METKSDEIKVGIFVLIGLTLLSISILLIGGDKFLFKSYYNLQVNFKQTQGLNKGSVVSLSGIPVGNIKKINFTTYKKQPVINVILSIEKKYKNLIKTDSMASIKTKGALGDKFIYITTGTPQGSPLSENQVLKTSQEEDLLDLLSNSSTQVQSVFDVIQELKTLLKSVNSQNRPEKILSHLEASAKNLNLTLLQTQNLLKYFKDHSKSLEHLENILSKIDQGKGSLGALINDPIIHKKLVKVLGGDPNTSFLKPLIYDNIKNRSEELKDTKDLRDP